MLLKLQNKTYILFLKAQHSYNDHDLLSRKISFFLEYFSRIRAIVKYRNRAACLLWEIILYIHEAILKHALCSMYIEKGKKQEGRKIFTLYCNQEGCLSIWEVLCLIACGIRNKVRQL